MQSGITSVSECCWCQTQGGCSSPGRAPHAYPTRCNRRRGGGCERNRLRREGGTLRGRKRRISGRTKEGIMRLRFCMRKVSCHRSVPFGLDCQPPFTANAPTPRDCGHARRDSRSKSWRHLQPISAHPPARPLTARAAPAGALGQSAASVRPRRHPQSPGLSPASREHRSYGIRGWAPTWAQTCMSWQHVSLPNSRDIRPQCTILHAFWSYARCGNVAGVKTRGRLPGRKRPRTLVNWSCEAWR